MLWFPTSIVESPSIFSLDVTPRAFYIAEAVYIYVGNLGTNNL